MTEFETRTADYIWQHHMLQKGDTVIVALSGGADSMALFRFLLSWREKLGITLRAAHVNHGLRGADADADAGFVRGQCAAHDIMLDETKLDAPKHAGEAWGREQRYLFFARLARRYGAKVATAHTANDNAETVLFRLARGASVQGAAGIPPVRDIYIRPLLWAQRAQIEAYLESCGAAYVTDATNETDLYARNRIRHGVLPVLESAHPGAVQNLARFAGEMARLAEYLNTQADALLTQARLPYPDHLPKKLAPAYDAAMLAASPPPVRRAALANLIACVSSQKTELAAEAERVLCRGFGTVQLCETLVFRVAQGRVSIEAPPDAVPWTQPEWNCPFLPGVHEAPGGMELVVQLLNYEKNVNSGKDAENHLKFCADYDRIGQDVCFRTRRSGDQFRPAGRGVTKPLKKWLSEQKLPTAVRGMLPVLAAGSEILWAPGFGFAEGLKATEQTKTAVMIKLRQMEETG